MEMNLLTLSVVKVVLKWVLAVVVDVCCLYRKYKKTKKNIQLENVVLSFKLESLHYNVVRECSFFLIVRRHFPSLEFFSGKDWIERRMGGGEGEVRS